MEPQADFISPSTPDVENERLELARAQQDVVVDIFRRFRGGDTVEIRSALVAEFESRGLLAPVEPWIDAVAFDTSEGRLYIVAPGLDIPSDVRDDVGVSDDPAPSDSSN
jgi:hypothetical protein